MSDDVALDLDGDVPVDLDGDVPLNLDGDVPVDLGGDVRTSLGGVPVLLCAPGGNGPARISGERDAVELVGAALGHDVDIVVVPVERLDDRFFTLRTGIAGEIVQKFVNYRLRLVIVGDISAHLAASSALRDFVTEANRGRHLWFVTSLADLEQWPEGL